MQGRYRNADEGRGYNSNPSFRNFNNRNKISHNRNNSFSRRSNLPPPPPSKQEILMRAGKLAAEYLVSQGLLAPEKLPQSRGQNGRVQDFRGHNRAANSRRYDDDDDFDDESARGKRRMGEYDREYYDNETDDDFSRAAYRKERKSGFDQLPARSENTMESGSENQDITEDSGSKISSLSLKKDALHEVVGDNVVVNSEVNNEDRSAVCADVSNKKILDEETEGESGKSVKDDVMKVVQQESLKVEEAVDAEVKNTESNVEENKNETEMIALEESNKRKREENDLPVNNVEAKELSPDEEVVVPTEVEGGKPEGEIIVKIQEEEKQLTSEPFKTCDLNFIDAPEVTELAIDTEQVTELPIDTEPTEFDNGKEVSTKIELPVSDNSSRRGDEFDKNPCDEDKVVQVISLEDDVAMDASHSSKGGDEFDKVSCDEDKVVQVISLEDDVAMDASSSSPPKPKDEEPAREEPVYPNLDSFLNQPEHADLTSIQDGYSLEFSDFLEPSVPNHLTNLESRIEGVPNDDDSIYGLGGMPIDFMEVWDQPTQDYGKFF